MSKQDFLANGGTDGMIYDLRWPLALVGTGVGAFYLGRNSDAIIQNLTDPGKKRQAYLNAQENVKAFKEQGLMLIPAGYVQQQGLQAGIASVLPGVQPSGEDKTYKMLSDIENMLKNYGERIARLEGKTEAKPQTG
jgi:hypothetical protein